MAKFEKRSRTHYIYLPCYVDDILLAATYPKIIEQMICHMENYFEVKNESKSGNYLSLQVHQLQDGSMTIGQID